MRFELGTVTPDQVVEYYQVSTRLERASQILDHVTKDAPGIAIVRSQSKSQVRYVTDTRAGTCSCPDWTFRGSVTGIPCKHLLAAKLRERLN